MKNVQPETLTLDRIVTPVGEVLLVTDGEGAVRALDFCDYETRMLRLLRRHCGADPVLVEGRAPETVRRAVEAYFSGEVRALDGVAVKTGGTAFQKAVWAALRVLTLVVHWAPIAYTAPTSAEQATVQGHIGS